MPPFLERLAHQLWENHAHELDRIAVVLPGKRAGGHLRDRLFKVGGRAMWSPELMDMGSFMERLSSLRPQPFVQGGSLEMLLLLYEAHGLVEGARRSSLAEFLEWAPVTLRDLSEVDAHLLDRDALYRDLNNYHELDEWSFRLGELSPGQERLSAQWRKTGDLHRAFTDLMEQRGIATSGHLSRHCAECVDDLIPLVPWNMVWFAGLNALDPASTAVIAGLQEHGIAKVAWNADSYYIDDDRQEAGRYLRRSISKLGVGELPVVSDILDRVRLVRSVATSHPIAQTVYAAGQLSGLSMNERAKTVVVLGQEDLLLPLLEQLPNDIGPLNITMGQALVNLPVEGLTRIFLRLHASKDASGCFQLSQLEQLLAHPLLICSGKTRALLASLHGDAQAWIGPENLLRKAEEVGLPHREWILPCFDVGQGRDGVHSATVALLSWAKNTASDPYVLEQLFVMARAEERLHRALGPIDPALIDMDSYLLIRDRLLKEERISFLGEPLKGLQIMGMLESRALEHERLFLLSVNEGTVPPNSGMQSWIPFEIRRHYDLPLPADGEAISAYHFASMMQGASEVDLVHTVAAGKDPAEASRFLAQWEREVVPNSRTTWSKSNSTAAAVVRTPIPVIVHKDEAVMQRLALLAERGLSPSALGTWITCPLDFYFKYCVGIKEKSTVDGTLGSDVLGDAVHHVLQVLYTPHIGTTLNQSEVRKMMPEVAPLLRQRLEETYAPSTLAYGHYKLRMEMAQQALSNYLKAEAKRVDLAPARIINIEQDVKGILPNGVALKGRCDRIDERKGVPVILDLKTGSVNPDDLKLTTLERDRFGPGKRYALQLIIYAWCYMQEHVTMSSVSAAVLPLRRPGDAEGEFLRIGGSDTIGREMLPDITAALNELVNDLMDPDIPFQHDTTSRYCTCCAG